MDQKADYTNSAWPIVNGKEHASPSVFQPEALLREARRQKGVPLLDVPQICMLDPDGDVVRHLRRTGAGRLHQGWACYHTELLAFDLEGIGEVGVVGCAVGAPFAVLVAEQLFVAGASHAKANPASGAVTFNGLGRIVANRNGQALLQTINVTHDNDKDSIARALRLVIGSMQGIKLCDPALDNTFPAACPPVGQ